MSQILELYAEILESKQRFIDEVFHDEIYRSVYPQLTILDVGAYEGEFSFACLNFAKQIYAFEPDPRPWKVLQERHEKFNLGDKMKIYNLALSAKTGTRIFHASGYGGSRLLDKDSEHDPKEVIKVKTISLGDFMKENEINQIDILKIDIEDGEKEIIKDSNFAELSKKIKLIIGEHLGAVEGNLRDLGYTPRVVEGANTLYERIKADS